MKKIFCFLFTLLFAINAFAQTIKEQEISQIMQIMIPQKKIDTQYSKDNFGMTNAQKNCEIRLQVNQNKPLLPLSMNEFLQKNNQYSFQKLNFLWILYHEYGHCILGEKIMNYPEKITWFDDYYFSKEERVARRQYIEHFNQTQILMMISYFNDLKNNKHPKLENTPVQNYHEYFSDLFGIYLFSHLFENTSHENIMNNLRKDMISYKKDFKHFSNDQSIHIFNTLFEENELNNYKIFSKYLKKKKEQILNDWYKPINQQNVFMMKKHMQEFIQIILMMQHKELK